MNLQARNICDFIEDRSAKQCHRLKPVRSAKKVTDPSCSATLLLKFFASLELFSLEKL